MDRKTLTGFILIGAILLLWPSYLELISPSEKSKEDVVTPDTSLVEKYSEQTLNNPVKTVLENPVVEEQTFIIKGKNYTAEVSNVGGGSITSYTLKKHLKKLYHHDYSMYLRENIADYQWNPCPGGRAPRADPPPPPFIKNSE